MRDRSDRSATASVTEASIGAVLAGRPAGAVAEEFAIDPAELAEAVDVYRSAGRHALHQRSASTWRQIYVEFPDWNTAERIAADHLAPLLRRAEADGRLDSWWFMRKHPCWRLRLRPGPAGADLVGDLSPELHRLVAANRIAGWRTGVYEAETAAFGGSAAMDTVHKLFTVDSAAILDLACSASLSLGRRELTVLLVGTLLQAARLEWCERGDVWHRIAAERPVPADAPDHRIADMGTNLRQLLRTDTSADGPLFGPSGALHGAAPWAGAFRTAGHTLGTDARNGTLQRGLREILSYLVIFHWNRLGLPTRTQAILAAGARTAILGAPPPVGPR